MRYYSDEEIKKSYLQMLDCKAKKQKEVVDKKVSDFEHELDLRSEAFKQKAADEMQKQLEMIEKNTEMFKKQVREEAEIRKKMIDENLTSKKERTSVSFSVEDIKMILEFLNK